MYEIDRSRATLGLGLQLLISSIQMLTAISPLLDVLASYTILQLPSRIVCHHRLLGMSVGMR